MTQKRNPWKKNLYENEGYPDNYTDPSFLEELKKNINLRQVTLTNAFLGAGLVTQELCLVVYFVVAFTYLYNEWITAECIFFWSNAISLSCYAYYVYNDSVGIVKHLKMVVIFTLFGYILSPVLKTLTETISTDTIYATTVFMMIVHMTFFDYGVKALIVSSSLSLNAAIFGSICLVSRLPTPFHAFVLLTISVQSFVLFPLLLAKIGTSLTALFFITASTICLLCTFSMTITVLFVITVTFINLLCPFWFHKWQKYKENIYGPWDEAVVQDIKL
ncbi:phosphatidylinositol N-acetylglucosaminyltransferase subunit C [Nilaparvata lugens]|uniref:phosphatidylinositol N-acetylglucosaminyltransferase subunit C n=1 Tax=Nilaparvata lugens TaxID=108931 RepID=UPI000B98EEF4|nr:phosphatidylinositol N-acetylglucosaminyltransferase subunit C [Nilaparvata lugens]XP_039286755.1 phosphatidylinositol N-acetylglucosaminyltransferase subunit C [Nilaparvata lugens]